VFAADGAGRRPRGACHEAERIFEAFEQGSLGQDSGHAGLGLAICRRIAQAHGGQIRLETSTRGACFIVQLPFVAGQPMAGVAANAAATCPQTA